MTTLINAATLARLVAVSADMAKLYDNGWIRDTGEGVFRGARQELADIIATATEPVIQPPAVQVVAMPVSQVEAMVDAVVARVEAAQAEGAAQTDAIVSAIRAELEESDLTVIAAVSETRADLLAAMPKPAPAAE